MTQSISPDRRGQLSQLVKEFRAAPSMQVRASVAEQVGFLYANGALNDQERSLACSICEACARDIAVQVRAAISEQLCRSPLLPAHLARQLAEDVEAVATPVLAYSAALTDADLLEVMETASQDKLMAISRRRVLSGDVGHALVERGDAQVVGSVLGNPKAALGAASLERALERYPDDESVHEAMVDRSHLPASVAVKLISVISRDLIKRVVAHRDFAPELVFDIARRAEDAALLKLPDQQADGLVDALFAQDRLTPMLLLRALVMRQRTFFVLALARLTSHPEHKVERRLRSGGVFECRELFKKARLPASLFSAFNAALSVLDEAEAAGTAFDEQAFETELVHRLARAYPTVAPTSIDRALAEIEQTVPRLERIVARRASLH